MIRPGVTAAGDRVRLPVGEQLLAPLVDALAIAYTNDPEIVGRLLAGHAARVLRLDHAECSLDMPDHVRSMCAAEVDGTREALLAELPDEVQRDPLLTPGDTVALATHLNRLAGFISTTAQKRNART
ncbi:hypothetical protein J7F02_16540 [Streptomyces sp. ISL-112]|uniref:hypothetical protein n=1 Tax=unclassified Streptomyces TaxID=2593676 RepID=UPI001BE6B518|nr:MULTISPECIES: hypothetical protein [unclassified Streptomyces]MBT2427235.1 hypothetical protein [Streptomyces sp. ISL-112]MBT2465779.1 hypothetical protein [Streptomyces sp. ISL-63]